MGLETHLHTIHSRPRHTSTVQQFFKHQFKQHPFQLSGREGTPAQGHSHAKICLVRILDLSTDAGQLPDDQVAGLVDTAQQGGVQVGKGQVRDCASEALEKCALGRAQAQDTDHRVVVCTCSQTTQRRTKIKNLINQ